MESLQTGQRGGSLFAPRASELLQNRINLLLGMKKKKLVDLARREGIRDFSSMDKMRLMLSVVKNTIFVRAC